VVSPHLIETHWHRYQISAFSEHRRRADDAQGRHEIKEISRRTANAVQANPMPAGNRAETLCVQPD
jgi:hypothetical protein